MIDDDLALDLRVRFWDFVDLWKILGEDLVGVCLYDT
jgi:hypothetical protein